MGRYWSFWECSVKRLRTRTAWMKGCLWIGWAALQRVLVPLAFETFCYRNRVDLGNDSRRHPEPPPIGGPRNPSYPWRFPRALLWHATANSTKLALLKWLQLQSRQ